MDRPIALEARSVDLPTEPPFQLGRARIDPEAHEYVIEGKRTRMQPQTLKVLVALHDKRGRVVSRDELIDRCWGGRIVGDDVINRCISQLRSFATESGGFEIETISGAGYRFVEQDRVHGLRWAALTLIVVTAAVGGGVYFANRQQPSVTPAALTVAVRPFIAPSGDSASKDLAERAGDATTRMLTESGIEVIDGNSSSPTKADFILTGSVEPIDAGHVATIRVEDPVHHSIVVTRPVESTPADPEAFPDQIGAQISATLSKAAPFIRLDRVYPSDPALLANVLNSNSSSFESQRNFEIARRIAPNAPNSAIAQWSLAIMTGLNMEVTPTAQRAATLAAGRDAAARLLRLAPRFGDSYLPWCFLHAEVRLAECEGELDKGLAIDPRAQWAGVILGKLLINVGRLDDALAIEKTALAKDPYGGAQIEMLLVAQDAAGDSQGAGSLFERGHRLRPLAVGLLLSRATGMLGRGDFDALSRFENRIRASGIAPNYKSIAAPLARAIDEGSLPLAHHSCRTAARDDDLQNTECMLALARLGDLDGSFEFADRLYPRRTGRTTAEEEAIWLSNPDDFDTLYLTGSGAAPMRNDPRYLQLADRLGLLRYWRHRALPDFCTKAHEPECRQIAAH